MNDELTPKQKKFCFEYALNPNAKQAALKAGYSEKQACAKAYLQLKNPKIVAYIKELIQDDENYFQFSRSTSFKNLTELQKLALSKKTKRFTKNGSVVEIETPDFSVYLKAEELKGKLQGFYLEPQGQTTNLNLNSMGSVKINNNKLELRTGQKKG